MLELARRFISSKNPSYEEALWGLRLLFSGAFLLQLGFATVFGLVLTLTGLPSPRASNVLMQVLYALAGATLFLGLLISLVSALSGGKDKTLFAALVLGGMLAAPVWFMVLVVVVGGEARALSRLGALLALSFPLGFFVAGSYARLALRPQESRQEEPRRDD